MRFKDVFSIIGPSMIGPSSSHTAGAVRLGRLARRFFGEPPEFAEIVLYGSFADTGQGHGTDLALVAGVLDFATDDPRIRHSTAIAEASGLEVRFRTSHKAVIHPNTATITLKRGDRADRVSGSSIGGGNIEMFEVNGFDVRFGGESPTLLIFHDDRSGMVARVTSLLSEKGINIGHMGVDRKSRNGEALSVIETDGSLPADIVEAIRSMSGVRRVCVIDFDETGLAAP